VTARLTELKGAGVVKNLECPDGSKVWELTEEGARRHDYYVRRGREKGA